MSLEKRSIQLFIVLAVWTIFNLHREVLAGECWELSVAAFGAGALGGAVAALVGFGVSCFLLPVFALKLGITAAIALVSIPHAAASAVRYWRHRFDVYYTPLLTFGVLAAAGARLGASLRLTANGAYSNELLVPIFGATGVGSLAGLAQPVRISKANTSVCFTLPSAILMIAFAYGVAAVGDLRNAGWLHGLKLAAVAVVAQAVWGMGKNLCTDRARVSICLASAAVLLAIPGAVAQIGVIVGGALVGWWLYRRTVATVSSLPVEEQALRHHVAAATALIVFAALLVVLPALATSIESRPIAVFDSFYRSGSLVFGGGHVVLPLLRAEIVPRGWLGDDQFLAGYGAAQALPGPMFAFSAYLGAAMRPGSVRWISGVWCLFAIFLPAWLLIGGALPFWHQVRAKRWAQAALAGANASVVGVLLAALYSPVVTEGVRNAGDVAVVLVAFGLLESWKAPPWLVVAMAAAGGQSVLR